MLSVLLSSAHLRDKASSWCEAMGGLRIITETSQSKKHVSLEDYPPYEPEEGEPDQDA